MNRWEVFGSIAFLAFLAVVLPGCATIISGTRQEIAIQSLPPGAEVLINGVHAGRTPAETEVGRIADISVTAKLPGGQERTLLAQSAFNIHCLWEIILWPALIVDLATGACYEFEPVLTLTFDSMGADWLSPARQGGETPSQQRPSDPADGDSKSGGWLPAPRPSR